jgi:hypothetical protein
MSGGEHRLDHGEEPPSACSRSLSGRSGVRSDLPKELILRALPSGQPSPDTKGITGGKKMKMKTSIMTLAATVICLATGLPAAAQAQENQVYIAATYFHCDSAKVEKADDAVAKLYKGALDGMVKDGTVSSWGWLGKYVGGEWARAGYFTGSSLKAVLDAGDKLDAASHGHPQVKGFLEACGSGEDYIWHVLAGNDAQGHRGKVSFSTYYVCDQSRETQADALVKRVIGPTYDKLVSEGKLATWAWAEHIVGGKYRRLATMTADSRDALIAAREGLVAAAEHDPLDEAMTSICGSHQDFIWDVKDQGSR